MVTTNSIVCGLCGRIPSRTESMIFLLAVNKSSRDIPGLRAIPAVIMTRSESLVSA